MAVETELKLSLSPRDAARLPEHPLLQGIAPTRKRLRNTYYDTADLALKKARIAVRHRRIGRQWLLTIKSAEPATGGLAQRSEWETPCQPGQFHFIHVADAELRQKLQGLQSELQPAFSTDFTRLAWLLRPATGVCIELALDRGHIDSNDRRERICEVELELIEGTPADLFALALALQKDTGLHPSIASKAERGYRVFAGAAEQAARAGRIRLPPSISPIDAFRIVAFSCVEQLQRNEAGLHESDDPEFIHQARVAIRRLRSALKLWAPILPDEFKTCFQPAWRDIGNNLGDARNWDVFATQTLPQLKKRFPEHPAIARLSAHTRRQQLRARRAARAAMSAPSYSQLLLVFADALLALPADPSGLPLEPFARTRLKRRMRAISRAAESAQTDPASRHALRIAFKRLRYALEFFESVYSDRASKAALASACKLQELLGELNDLAIAEQLVAGLRLPRGELRIQDWLQEHQAALSGKLTSSLNFFCA